MIGILGGTFDPVHYGHLKPAFDVMQALNMEKVLFVPNRIPPHRQEPWLNVEQRKQLLEIAVGQIQGFEIDTRELEREGKSYMVDTLVSLRDDYPDHSLCLILGMDAFAGLHEWHQWRRIPELCHLVITHRPGFDWPKAPELAMLETCLVINPETLKQSRAGKILLKSVAQLDISSSDIRKRLQTGEDISDLMPEAVYKKLLEIKQTI